jgi:hypothetical protein
MVPLLVLLLAGVPQLNSLPDQRLMIREVRPLSVVTDKDLRPVRPPECKTDAEVVHAVEQVRNGMQGDCWVRDATAFNRH